MSNISQDTLSNCKFYAHFPLKRFKLNSGFGFRIHPVTGERKSFHKGIDIKASNEIVCSILPGEVIKIGFTAILGNFVAVRHGNYIVYYAHLSKIYCVTGQRLFTEYPVGLSGATGRTTGEHLHLTVLKKGIAIDPLYFLLAVISRTGKDLRWYLLNE
ncbi:M23 family metallopeptidase [Pedobacter sp. MW01-1-1]|uniref:M23 family metallopeptidase n=1 Tax=Pedobacter sp. MW01-1-1 TaxID=3383027 RepID=UPI003FF079BF